MSVIKSKRSLSDLKFFHNALVLRRAIATLLLKDFGVKDKCRSVKLFEHLAKISEEDKKVIEPIFEKYNIVTISSEWPGWLLTKFRDSLYELSKNMMHYVVAANSVYQNSTAECIQRRELQNAAIYSCQQLLIEMQFVISILPVNAEKLQPFITMISEEIFLLKRFNSHRTLLSVQNYFISLFKKELEDHERKRKIRTGNPKFNLPAEFLLITNWRLENRKISGISGSRSNGSL